MGAGKAASSGVGASGAVTLWVGRTRGAPEVAGENGIEALEAVEEMVVAARGWRAWREAVEMPSSPRPIEGENGSSAAGSRSELVEAMQRSGDSAGMGAGAAAGAAAAAAGMP